MLKSWNQVETERVAERESVPALINSPVRKHGGKSWGQLNREEYSTKEQYSIADALKSPRRDGFQTQKPEKSSRFAFEVEQYQRKDPKQLETLSDIKTQDTIGVGVFDRLGGKAATSAPGVDKSVNSYHQLRNEEHNKTTVAQALGGRREDNIGRTAKWEANRNAGRDSMSYLLGAPQAPTARAGRGDGSSESVSRITSSSNASAEMHLSDAPTPTSQSAPSPAAAAAQIQSKHRVETRDDGPTRRVSFGAFSSDVVSNRAQYSTGQALMSPRGGYLENKPEKNSRFFMEQEQYQHKSPKLYSNPNDIARQSRQGVGVFQAMSYQVEAAKS